ncbi:hypothetical protein [Emticicia sp. BO119]|uniref:hypothetical protein n=1 Tax=Emticicia sp. BO119 TaxID=2757768 RepID=UPI0015F1232A|nr:hypothetical protein [Emticicia sp. BO119]MBA4852078.1 hypothetical protein [Emticicia sp. BO119]
MGNLITIGLSKIEIGDKAVDEGMGTTLATVGYTAEGSCTIETTDPEIQEFFAEEVDTAIHTSAKGGTTTVTFQLASPDLDQCAAVFGGTVTGTGTAKTWEYPDAVTGLEKSIKITPKEGIVFKIPRGKMVPKFTGQFGRADTLKIEVSISVLQPLKSGVKPMLLSLVAGES